MRDNSITKKEKSIFMIEIFVLIIINIFMLFKLEELSNDRIKFTLASLCILISVIVLIISVIAFFKRKKNI